MPDSAFHWPLGEGHFPNQPRIGGQPGTWLKARNCWAEGNGTVKAWNGMLATAVAGADTMMLIENDPSGIGQGQSGYGTVFGFRAGSVCFIGSGKVIRRGVQIGVAVTGMQILKDGVVYLLGLTAPPAVTIAAGGAGIIEGYISIVVTYVRSATGEESNGSEPSNSLYLGLKKVSIPLPGAPAGTVGNATTVAQANAGVDRARIYSTFPGFSRIGPWLWTGLEESALGTTVEREWTPGKLSSLGRFAPITYNPPPVGTHGATVAGIIIVMGARGPGGGAGGFGLAPSLQATLGWDASHEIFLRPGQPITGVKGEQVDGQIVISTYDYVHGCLYAPSPAGSILTRVLSTNTGFPDADSWTVIGGEIWGVNSRGEICRSTPSGEFETEFAWPILPDIAGLPKTGWKVGYAGREGMVVFANGTTALAYNRRAPGDRWSGLLDLPATAQAACAADGKLYLALGSGATRTLYAFNEGAGGYSFAQVVPVFQSDGRGNGAITELAVDGETTVKCRILTNLDLTPAAESYATFDADPNTRDFGIAGASRSRAAQVHFPGTSFTPELRWTTPGAVIYGVEAKGYSGEEWMG